MVIERDLSPRYYISAHVPPCASRVSPLQDTTRNQEHSQVHSGILEYSVVDAVHVKQRSCEQSPD